MENWFSMKKYCEFEEKAIFFLSSAVLFGFSSEVMLFLGINISWITNEKKGSCLLVSTFHNSVITTVEALGEFHWQ